MDKCVKCNKQLLLRRKFYKYHGKKKGSFELTEGKVYCKKCYNSMYFLKEPNNEEFCELVIKIREKNIKKH
ncbi:MAG: hypothetical protein QF568_03740, partial [Flavobacteriales bacterium]|nr:hypothetical protein [Flavobacteriales bacterium]